MKWGKKKRGNGHGEEENGDSRERVSDFSLEIHTIGPLDFDGARRKTFYAEQATRGPRICEF